MYDNDFHRLNSPLYFSLTILITFFMILVSQFYKIYNFNQFLNCTFNFFNPIELLTYSIAIYKKY